MSFAGRKANSKKSEMIDLRDPKVREEFLMGEISKANQKMAEGTSAYVILSTFTIDNFVVDGVCSFCSVLLLTIVHETQIMLWVGLS